MLEKRIEEWVEEHCGEMTEDIACLVRIPSVSAAGQEPHVYGEGCARALDTMLALGEKYGFETENAGYRCGVIRFGDQEKSVGLWGHLDVVPEGNGWLYPPYDCVRRGDFLIGRGTQDNKGPSVAGLYAMRCIKELGLPMGCRIEQVLGCAEETGMEDVAGYVREHPVPDFNIVTDCGFPVCYGEKGIIKAELRSGPLGEGLAAFESGTVSNIVPDLAVMRLRAGGIRREGLLRLPGEIEREAGADEWVLTARGISGHAAFPRGSVNAAAVLSRAVLDAGLLDGADRAAVETLERICASADGSALSISCEDDISGALTCVGGVVRLKEGRLSVQLDIRYPIGAKGPELTDALRARAAVDGWELLNCTDDPANYFDPASPYVGLLTGVYNRVMHTDAKPFVMGGGTYARKIPRAVAFGPGGLPSDASGLGLPPGHGGCHAPDELQSVSCLQTAVKIYVLALLELGRAMSGK